MSALVHNPLPRCQVPWYQGGRQSECPLAYVTPAGEEPWWRVPLGAHATGTQTHHFKDIPLESWSIHGYNHGRWDFGTLGHRIADNPDLHTECFIRPFTQPLRGVHHVSPIILHLTLHGALCGPYRRR
jgi:hypothetical protein